MRELIQRLSALDDDAASAMKMVAHFDALLAQGAGMTALVRSAAVLSGCPCGMHLPRHSLYTRVDAQGRAMKAHPDPSVVFGWPHQMLEDGSDGVVWLERPSDQVGAGDAMILERLAAGIHLTVERVSPMTISDDAAAVEIIVTASSLMSRRKALQRLRLRESTPVRVVAARDDVAGERTASLSSAVGSVRVALAEDGQSLPAACGVGERVAAMEAHTTLNQAVQALALSSRINPVVFSEQWGLVAALAASPDAARHPDVQRLAGLGADPAALETLEALALSDTVRGAAALLGLHHSTVQQRQTRLEELIGYRISSPLGRTRTLVALAVHRTRTSLVHADLAEPSDD